MLGYLLARAGVPVIVVEKHADFLRDFRGDTVHPSTIELMYELGIDEDFFKLPHNRVDKLEALIGDEELKMVDFSYLRTKAKFIAFMPQWDFLDFIAGKAKQYDDFSLMTKTTARALIEIDGRVKGIIADTVDGEVRIEADLVVGADGRTSIVRSAAGLEVKDIGAPMDVLWMRLSRNSRDPSESLGRLNRGIFLIMLNRGDYWQCGLVIPKGRFDEYKQEGLDRFRARIGEIAPFLNDRLDELADWDTIKLLTVKVDRLKKWHKPGLLCIGDAAHAMSPVGGVGINLAIQDAVATANLLYRPLLENNCTEDDLAAVQERRMYPARMTQRLQVAIQKNIVRPALEAKSHLSIPLPAKLFNKFAPLRAIPATIIGVGFRPEHIETPDVHQSSSDRHGTALGAKSEGGK